MERWALLARRRSATIDCGEIQKLPLILQMKHWRIVLALAMLAILIASVLPAFRKPEPKPIPQSDATAEVTVLSPELKKALDEIMVPHLEFREATLDELLAWLNDFLREQTQSEQLHSF